MKLLTILTLLLASCAGSKQYTSSTTKTVIFAKDMDSGSIVKLSGMRRKYYLPKKYNVGDTINIYFVNYKYKAGTCKH